MRSSKVVQERVRRGATLRALAVGIAVVIAAVMIAAPIAARGAATEAASPGHVVARDPGSFVVDTANLLDAATRERMERLLLELQQKTGAEVKVLTVSSLGDEDIFGFSQRQAQLWKLGQKGKNNGALIVLALKEHKVRIHTYYGLEGVLPDSWCGTASRQVAATFFKQGQYSRGLEQLTAMVATRVADDAGVKLQAAPALTQPRPQASKGSGWIVVFFFVLVILIIVGSNRSNRGSPGGWAGGGGGWQSLLWWSLLNNMSRGSGGWSGSSGGGFGGFGGGGFGGGSFGSGGSSGGGGGGASW